MNRRLILWALVVLSLQGQPVQIRTAELPWAMIGAGYHFTIETGADGRCPGSDVVVSLQSGRLPRGLEIRGEYLMGTPRELGKFHVTLRASNTCSATVKAFDLVVTGKPILSVYPEQLSFEAHVGKSRPAAQTVRVSSTWPNLQYLIEMDASWLVPKQPAGVTPDAGAALAADVIPIEVNPKNLPPGVYRTAVKLSTWQGGNTPEVAVMLTILP